MSPAVAVGMRNTDGPNKLGSIVAVAALTASAVLTPSVVGAATEVGSGGEGAAQQLNSPDWLDTENRQTVIDSFDNVYSVDPPEMAWTGDYDTCDAGTISNEYRQATIDRVNWFRSIAGVPPVTLDLEASGFAQKGAIIASTSSPLTHYPTSDATCYSAIGAEATASSNLSRGSNGPKAIDRYITDFGPGNEEVGHRNWILNPTSEQFGTADVPQGTGNRRGSNALRTFEEGPILFPAVNPTLREDDGWVAWPARGYTPAAVVYERWSFSLRHADFTRAAVSTQLIENGVATEIASPIIHNNSKPDTAPFEIIVWEPQLNFPTVNNPQHTQPLPQPAFDQTYRITISGVETGGTTRTFVYDVTVIGEQEAPRPAQAPAPAPQGPTDTQSPTSEPIPVPSADFAADQLDRLYSAYFLRGGDDSGLDYWLRQLAEGAMTVSQVSEAFARAPEFNSMYGNLDDTSFVELVYQNVLDRNADAAGLAYWTDRMADGLSRGEMMTAFADSAENVARTSGSTPLTPTESKVWRLYAAVFNRIPDSGGLSFWTGQLNQLDLGVVAETFTRSPEFVQSYGTLSDQEFVTLLYQSVLGREPDAGGLSHWESQLQLGMTRGEVVLAFSNSPEFVRKSGTIY